MSVSSFLQRNATRDQVVEFLRERSARTTSTGPAAMSGCTRPGTPTRCGPPDLTGAVAPTSTSSMPSRRIAVGIERVGLPDAVAAYFREHVEADAVHEQVAIHDICCALVLAEPGLPADVRPVLRGACT